MRRRNPPGSETIGVPARIVGARRWKSEESLIRHKPARACDELDEAPSCSARMGPGLGGAIPFALIPH